MQVSDGVVFKKTWRNNISFKKETEKIVLLQMKGLIQIIVKFRTVKYLRMFLLSNTSILLEGHTLIIVHHILWSSCTRFREWLVSVSQKTQNISCNVSLVLKPMPYFLSIFTLSDELLFCS